MCVLVKPACISLTQCEISGNLEAGLGRVALVLLVAPYGMTSAKAYAPRPDGYFFSEYSRKDKQPLSNLFGSTSRAVLQELVSIEDLPTPL
jgi:hypothetical protein